MCNNLTVLVQSCDKYSDLWPVFFNVFSKQWGDCPYRIVLNTETKKYEYPGLKIECLQLYKDKPTEYIRQLSWSQRYIDTLEHIKTKYVFVILEDFFIRKKVNNSDVEKLIETIDKIKNFGAVYFNYKNGPTFYIKKCDLYFIHNELQTRINSVCGLWNIDVLKATLVPGESPWEYEQNATKRWKKKPTKFYSINPETTPIELNFREQVIQGKWSDYCVDLLSNMGISVDFEVRGIVKWPITEKKAKKTWKDHIYDICSKNLVLYDIFCKLRNCLEKIRRNNT